MSGCTKALNAVAPATGVGTVSRPIRSRLATSSRVPGVVLIVTSAMLSGVPIVSLVKLRVLESDQAPRIDYPGAFGVPIFRTPSLPVPVVGAAFAANRSLFSVRFDWR